MKKHQWGGQRRKLNCSIKRVGTLIAVVFVALIVNTMSGRGIQAKASDDNQIVKSGELGNITWTLDKAGLMTLAPKEGTDAHFGTSDSYPANIKWFSLNDRELVKKIRITDKIYADNLAYMFYFFTSLESIDGIENLDTSSTTNMSNMFVRCDNLTDIDVSNFNTSNVADMSSMFDGCDFRKLDVSNFDTSKVKYMDRMFATNFKLQSLNINNLDTSNVTNMSEMFLNCYKLQELNVSNFNTSKVEYMYSMFEGCSSLKKIDIRNFNTEHVVMMSQMFYRCNSLTYLDLSNFDTSGVINQIQDHLNKIRDRVWDWDFYKNFLSGFNDMLPMLSESKLRTISIGSKCYTLSTVVDGVIYKYGIQYALSNTTDDDKMNYIIRRQDNEYGTYDCSLKRDNNKKYFDGSVYGHNTAVYCEASYDSDFADAWKPEMAGTWIIEEAKVKYTVVFRDGLTNENISSVQAEQGSTITTPSAPTHDGYEFVLWDNKDKLTNIQSDVTVTATYKKIEKPNNNSNSSNSNTNSGNTGNSNKNNNTDNINTNSNANTNSTSNVNANDSRPSQTIPQVKSNINNQTVSNQPNELEQTGINLPSLFVPLSALLSVFLIAYYRHRSK